MYNRTQVKIGQTSRRAACADLGVAPGCVLLSPFVSISNNMTGASFYFFFFFFLEEGCCRDAKVKVIQSISNRKYKVPAAAGFCLL